MSKLKVVLNRSGVRELLQSQEMMDICYGYAQKVASSAGEGYKCDSYVGKTRVNASVIAETYQAKNDNLKNNTLVKALGSVK